ncbi:MAG: hypothetical protein IT323_03150, partial [Anaerolineae bacterium]|nr:hypothetical protein [Anaerolineae bacterium]
MSRSPWVFVALAAGALAGLLAPGTSALLLGIVALGILTLIDPRVGLLLTLAIAPLKALIETEVRTPLPLPLPLNAGHILLLGTLAVWAARSIASPRRRLDLPWSPIYAPVLLFSAAAALSLPGAASFSAGLTELLKWVEILLVMALVIGLGRDGGPGWIAAGLIASALPQALVGVYQFFGGSGAPHLWILNYQYFRAFGTFGQPNPFGAFMGLSLALALGVAFGQSQAALAAYVAFRRGPGRNERARLIFAAGGAALAWAAAGVLGAGLLVSWSRGAWLGFAAAFVTVLLFAPRRRIVGVALVLLLIAGLWLSIAAGLAPDALVARISDFAQ